MAGGAGPGTAYERGSQAILINASTTTVTQSGQAAPAGASVFGLPPTVSRGQLPSYISVQVDGVLAAGDVVNLLGSLDGVNFYVIASATAGAGPTGLVTAKGGIFETPIVAVVRWVSASITTKGNANAVTVSFAA
jgi:hypothetical protein